MFKGGIIQNIDASNLSNENLQDCNNVMTSKGSCRVRKGLSFYVVLEHDNWVKCLTRFLPYQGETVNLEWGLYVQ